MIWILLLVTVAGFIISMIFGTWGLSTTVIDAANTSGLGSAVVRLISFLAMLSINLNQFAKILEERKDLNLWYYGESFLYYAVDWTMTFAGFAGWSMINSIMSGETDTASSIYMGLLIALAAVGAGFTSYGTEYTLKEFLLRVNRYNGTKANFNQLQKGCYRLSGWIALGVSWAAGCFGIINIATFAGADVAYAPSGFAITAAAIALPVIFSGVEYWLLKEKDRSIGASSVLGIFFFLDAATIFGGLGGIAIMITLINGDHNGETAAILITAIVSKAFTAYLGAIGAETAHVDAENVDTTTASSPAPQPTAPAPQPQSTTPDAPPANLIAAAAPVGWILAQSRYAGYEAYMSPDRLQVCFVAVAPAPATAPAAPMTAPKPVPAVPAVPAKPEPTYHSLGFDSDEKNHPQG